MTKYVAAMLALVVGSSASAQVTTTATTAPPEALPSPLARELLGQTPVAPLTGSPYEIRLGRDLPILGLGLAGTSIAFVPIPPADCVPTCVAPADLNALDRLVLGQYSGTAHTIADISVMTLVLSPIVLDLLDSGGEGWLEDMVVYGQALALAQSAVQITKVAIRRNAPLLYGSDAPLEIQRSTDANRSFISGHTTMAFTAATTFAVTYWLRNPDDPLRWLVLIAGQALALGVGLLKIEAGYHYPTDIAVGALVGASIGVLVPVLHQW